MLTKASSAARRRHRPGARRRRIYQRSYYLRILKCMMEQFPALCHALGDELFHDFEVRRSWREPDGVRRRWLAAGFFVVAA